MSSTQANTSLSGWIRNRERSQEDICEATATIIEGRLADPKWTGYTGPTYMEIRVWISQHKHYDMENVDGRCKELFAEGKLKRVYDGKGHVHVYLNEEKKEEKQT